MSRAVKTLLWAGALVAALAVPAAAHPGRGCGSRALRCGYSGEHYFVPYAGYGYYARNLYGYRYGYRCSPYYSGFRSGYSWRYRSFGFGGFLPGLCLDSEIAIAPLFSRAGAAFSLDDPIFTGPPAKDYDGVPQPRTRPIGARFLIDSPQ